MLKKSISVLLAVIITLGVLTVIPNPVSAATTPTDNDQFVGLSTDNVEVSGSNSLGSMLAEEYEKNAGNLENTGSGIYAVEVEGKTARVDVRALVEAQLIVSVFDEEDNIMYGSGMTDVSTEDTIVELTLEIDTMPQYFRIKAFLLDKNTNQPLCKQFESDDYTQKMQEFLSKNTDDFDADKVLNLDDNRNNNFLVYNDDTIIIENDGQNTNVVTKADDKNKEYVIENIDDSIAALKPGDIFSYDFGEGMLIIKISTISINGTTATIHGDEMELKEAFDFIKIDTLSYANEARYDGSNISDGIEPIGTPKDSGDPVGASINHSESVGVTVADWDIESSHELKFKFGENKAVEEYYDSETTEHYELKKQMYGEFGVKLAVNFKFFYDEYFLGRDVEMSLTVKYEFSVSLKAKLNESKSSSLGLGDLFFEPVPGVTISITPSVVVSGKLKASFTLKFSGQIGFKYKNGQSENLGKSPSLDFDIDFEGELFIGLSLEPQISVLGDVAKATAEGIAGLRIKGKTHHSTSIPLSNSEPSEKHLCTACIEGDIGFVLELNVEMSLFSNPDLTWNWNLVKAEWKLTDFYWSVDHAEFGFSTCPYWMYKCTVTLLNPEKEPIEGATVNGVTTDSSGKAVMYLQKGRTDLEIKKGDKTVIRSLYVSGTEKPTYVIDFDKPENELSDRGKLVKSYRKVIQSGQCGYNVFYALYDDGLLVISGKGRMYNYTYSPWYDNRNKVKKAVIGNSVENICDHEFYGCTELTSVIIGNNVLSIGAEAFKDCTGLTSVTIPDSVTAILSSAFSNCSGLTSVIIGNGMKSLGGDTFSNCSGLTSVTFGNSVKLIGYGTFMNCTGLTSITIPDSVTSIGEVAFLGCTGLTSVTIPDSVTSIDDSAFRNCEKLTSVIIPESVTSIGDLAFCGCSKLTSVSIPNSVTSIGEEAFYGCTGLISVTIPDSVTSISLKEFYGCTGLTSVTIPNRVTSIGSSAFYGCTGLTSVTIPNSVTSIGYEAFRGCTRLTSVTIGNGVTSIGGYAFRNCTGLTSVTIPDGVTTIGDHTFSFCTGLTSVTIPDSVTSIGGFAFYACENLQDVYYGGSEEDWNKIVGTNSSSLSNVTIHYNSAAPASVGCAQPAEGSVTESVFAIENAAQPKAQQKPEPVPVGADDEEPNGFSRGHLVPETEAVLLIVKGTEETAVLNAASLLYIAQQTVDENGNVSFDVQQDFGDESWVAFIFGECDHSAGEWTVAKEATQDEEGLKVLICDHCSTVLDTETISALSGNVLCGDVNNDGKVNGADAGVLSRYTSGWDGYAEKIKDMKAADINGDGKVNGADSGILARYTSGWNQYDKYFT